MNGFPRSCVQHVDRGTSRRAAAGLVAAAMLLALVPLSAQSSTVAPDAPRTIIAERVQLADGRLVPGRAIVLGTDGKIVRIAAADDSNLPEPRLDAGAGSVLVPGHHEFLSSIGAPGELVETVEPFDVDANARTVIDPARRDLEEARRAGVLHATVAPAETNPVSGRAITIATGARRTLREITGGAPRGPLVFAVGESALDATREPTSRAGLRIALERWLATGGDSILDDDTRASVAPPLVHCSEAMDVRTALDLLGSRTPTIVLASGGTDAAALLARARSPSLVVVGPFGASTPIPELRGAAALSRSGTELVIRGSVSALGGDSLRDSARRAVAQGLDPAAARRALTTNPARAAGLPRTVGTIIAGARADLVLFDGDPLLPASQVVTVFESGRAVDLRAGANSASATPAAIPPLDRSTLEIHEEVPR